MNQLATPLELTDQYISDEDIVSNWLTHFERALNEKSAERITNLFDQDCHWRDMFAFTWSISPCEGQQQIAKQLLDNQDRVQARGFAIAEDSIAPCRTKRIGVPVIEAIISFETAFSRCKGVVRLLPDKRKAWIMMTSLRELKGHEEKINKNRPDGSDSMREFGGPNWADRRKKEQTFEDRDPAVLILGAGQSGLSMAARLRVLGVDALCVDKHERVGDSWRNRYHSLALHNQVSLNQMAYMPFPATWPRYISKDMIADWLEHYAWALECNVWMSTTLVKANYDAQAGNWVATLRQNGGTLRIMKPKHLVFANGIVGAPRIPDLSGLSDFKDKVLHTHDYKNGKEWKGKNVLVLGTGTSGHDVAQDLYGHGANVKMIQRSGTAVASLKAVSMVYTAYYKEEMCVEDADLLAQSSTYPIAIRNAQALTKLHLEIDKDLHAGLRARGFKLDSGGDDTGYLMKVRRSHAGYYFNCGCSDLIVEGKIGILHFQSIEKFVPEGALMKNGHIEKADLLIMATGYQPQQEVVRELLGNEIAGNVGPIWGIDADGEVANMYKPTGQKGLWFIGSGLSQARMYTHYVALQILAREIGLIA